MQSSNGQPGDVKMVNGDAKAHPAASAELNEHQLTALGIEYKKFQETMSTTRVLSEESESKLNDIKRQIRESRKPHETAFDFKKLKDKDPIAYQAFLKCSGEFMDPYANYDSQLKTFHDQLKQFAQKLMAHYEKHYEPLNELRKQYIEFLKKYAEERCNFIKKIIDEHKPDNDKVVELVDAYNKEFAHIAQISISDYKESALEKKLKTASQGASPGSIRARAASVAKDIAQNVMKKIQSTQISPPKIILEETLLSSPDLQQALPALKTLVCGLYQRTPDSIQKGLQDSLKELASKNASFLVLETTPSKNGTHPSESNLHPMYPIQMTEAVFFLHEHVNAFTGLYAQFQALQSLHTKLFDNYGKALSTFQQKFSDTATRIKKATKNWHRFAKNTSLSFNKDAREFVTAFRTAHREKIKKEQIAYRGITKALEEASEIDPTLKHAEKIISLPKMKTLLRLPDVALSQEIKRSPLPTDSSTLATQLALINPPVVQKTHAGPLFQRGRTIVALPKDTKAGILEQLKSIKAIAQESNEKILARMSEERRFLRSLSITTAPDEVKELTESDIHDVPDKAQRFHAVLHAELRKVDLEKSDLDLSGIQTALDSAVKKATFDHQTAMEEMLGIQRRSAEWTEKYKEWIDLEDTTEVRRTLADEQKQLEAKLPELKNQFEQNKSALKSFSPDEAKERESKIKTLFNQCASANETRKAILALPVLEAESVYSDFLKLKNTKKIIAILLLHFAKEVQGKTKEETFNEVFFGVIDFYHHKNKSFFIPLEQISQLQTEVLLTMLNKTVHTFPEFKEKVQSAITTLPSLKDCLVPASEPSTWNWNPSVQSLEQHFKGLHQLCSLTDSAAHLAHLKTQIDALRFDGKELADEIYAQIKNHRETFQSASAKNIYNDLMIAFEEESKEKGIPNGTPRTPGSFPYPNVLIYLRAVILQKLNTKDLPSFKRAQDPCFGLPNTGKPKEEINLLMAAILFSIDQFFDPKTRNDKAAQSFAYMLGQQGRMKKTPSQRNVCF